MTALVLIGLAGVLQITDLLTFMLAYDRYGIAGEASPVAQAAFATGGLVMVVSVKLMMVVFTLLVTLVLYRHQMLWRLAAGILITIGAVATATNVWAVAL